MRSYASSVKLLDRRAVRGAGAVDEHVDPPVSLDERVGEGVDGRHVGDVDRPELGLAAGALDLRHDLARELLVDVGDDHGRAGAGEPLGEGRRRAPRLRR